MVKDQGVFLYLCFCVLCCISFSGYERRHRVAPILFFYFLIRSHVDQNHVKSMIQVCWNLWLEIFHRNFPFVDSRVAQELYLGGYNTDYLSVKAGSYCYQLYHFPRKLFQNFICLYGNVIKWSLSHIYLYATLCLL